MCVYNSRCKKPRSLLGIFLSIFLNKFAYTLTQKASLLVKNMLEGNVFPRKFIVFLSISDIQYYSSFYEVFFEIIFSACGDSKSLCQWNTCQYSDDAVWHQSHRPVYSGKFINIKLNKNT